MPLLISCGSEGRNSSTLSALIVSAILAEISLAGPPINSGEISQPPPKGRMTVSRRVEDEKKNESKVIAILKLRPTFVQDPQSFYFENTAELGFQFSKNFALTYLQDFNVKTGDTAADSTGLVPKDGGIKLGFLDAWKSADNILAFTDEVRVYFPTDELKRNAGMVTQLRNYFKFTRTVTPWLTFKFYETPIVHIYTDPGMEDSKGTKTANPMIENQLWFEMDFAFSKSVVLEVPIKHTVTKARDYEGAGNDGAWSHQLIMLPALDFILSKNVLLGVGYNTGNFIQNADWGPVLNDGIATGAFQIKLELSL